MADLSSAVARLEEARLSEIEVLKNAAENCDGYMDAAFKDGFDVETLIGYTEQLLKAAQAVVEAYKSEGWRPIETAPKDGTPIVVWDEPWRHAITVRWGWKDDQSRDMGYSPTWWPCGIGCHHPTSPTRYMPLPAPPQVEGQT